MLNKLSQSKHNKLSKFFKSVVLTGTTLFVMLQPGYSKSNEKVKAAIKETLEQYDAKGYEVQEAKKTAKFNTIQNNNDALNFAVSNVSKYYPDMKEYLTSMINQFGTDKERKNAVDEIFNKTIMQIEDPKQKIWATIYALEWYVFWKSDFGDKHDSDITNPTFLAMEVAKVEYEIRLKKRIVNIKKIDAEIEKNTQELEKNKSELEKNNQELRNILNKITIQDIKNKEQIKKLVIKTKALFIKYWTKSNSKHIDELFKSIP